MHKIVSLFNAHYTASQNLGSHALTALYTTSGSPSLFGLRINQYLAWVINLIGLHDNYIWRVN